MEIITQRLKLKDTPYFSTLNDSKYKDFCKKDTEFIKKGIIPSDLQIKKGERAVISYITTKTPDRDREIVLPKGAILDDYNKHKVVLWGHDSSSPPIGVNMWVKSDDKGLIVKTRYHDKGRGKEIYDLLLDEIPVADSIGFIPISVIDKSEFGNIDKKALGLDGIDLRNVERIYDKWLLLEDSKVSVPSNPEALQLMMAKGLIKEIDLDRFYIEDVGKYLSKTITEEEDCKDCKLDLDKIEIDLETKQDKPLNTFKYCVCKACGYSEENKGEKPCQEKACPKCEAALMGSNNLPEEKEEEVTKPEGGRGWDETDSSFRYRVRSPESFQEGTFRTVPIKKTSPKINSVMGKLKNETAMTLQSLIFPKSENWTMEKARNWVNGHPDVVKNADKNKIVNKKFDLVTKEFSIGDLPSEPSTFYYDVYSKYLDCKVKSLYTTKIFFPNLLMGMYLYALEKSIKDFEIVDERNLNESKEKGESPCEYETIILNSKESKDFLVEGLRFYEGRLKFIIRYDRTWRGEKVTVVTDRKDREIINEILKNVERVYKEENKLKGEAFCLSGEFLKRENRTFDDIILEQKVERSIKSSVRNLQDKGREANGRGMMFIGYPGIGKTMTGKILMDIAKDCTFIWVSSKDFEYISVIEAISLGFSLARDLSPSILFMEDIDNWLAPYAIDLVKTEMDGIMENKGVLTILTTNHPKNFPKALIDRPGRFHDIVKFSFPDEICRRKMIEKWCDNIDKSTVDYLVQETKGYTGAYIKELVDFAQMTALDSDIDLEYSLFMSLEKIKEQRALVQDIQLYGDEILNKSLTKNLIIKSGRVISAKNLSKIKAAYDALAEVIKIAESNLGNRNEDEEEAKPEEKKQAPTEDEIDFSTEDMTELIKEVLGDDQKKEEELDISTKDIREIVKEQASKPYDGKEEWKKIENSIENAIAKVLLGKVTV